MFAPPVTRHPIWKPALGQTTTVVTTTTGGPGTEIYEKQSAGADMITLLVVTGAVLVVTEALGVTHVTKWASKKLGLSKK
jgi:hypothetical protein